MCVSGCAYVAAAFPTIKLIGNVSPEFPATPPVRKVFTRSHLSSDWSYRGEIYFANTSFAFTSPWLGGGRDYEFTIATNVSLIFHAEIFVLYNQ